MSNESILITGISGQDGLFLTDRLSPIFKLKNMAFETES